MQAIRNVYYFYRDGFARMGRLGRLLWAIVIVKLVIMFLVLKVFFFENYMSANFDTREQKAEYVIQALTGQKE